MTDNREVINPSVNGIVTSGVRSWPEAATSSPLPKYFGEEFSRAYWLARRDETDIIHSEVTNARSEVDVADPGQK